MKGGGTHVATGAMVGGGKWYLWCFRCGVVWCHLCVFFIRVEVLGMGRSVREVACFRACIWKEF